MASARSNSFVTSGGGFSDYYAMPSYQAAAVSAYLSSGAVTPGLGNFTRTGRAFPDVAAIGLVLSVWIYDQRSTVSETSSPIFAAILALANNALYARGLPPVGFVNPALYTIGESTPSAFFDVNCPGCVNNCNGSYW